jgi:hypothetical protein
MQTLNCNYNVFILRPGYWTVGVTPSLVVVGLNPREYYNYSIQANDVNSNCSIFIQVFL